jgi:hypothetical protein
MSENYGHKDKTTKFKNIGIARPIIQNPNTDPGFLVNSDPPHVFWRTRKNAHFPITKWNIPPQLPFCNHYDINHKGKLN